MGKVIKNVVKTLVATFCGLLLLALVLPLAGSLLVSLPAVQNAIVRGMTANFSESLGTRVSIDRVELRLINHARIEGFYVEDFGGDTLLYIPRLDAPIEGLGLGRAPLTLGRVKISGAQLWLRKAHPDEDMNISRLVDSIRRGPANPESKFKMRINAIEADSLTFGLFRGGRERRDEGVDWTRFVMKNVHTDIDDFSISGDTIRMNINSLSGVERTGWSVDNLSVHPLRVSRGAVVLSGVDIRSQGSELRLPYIRLEGTSGKWSDFREFSDMVSMEIATLPSTRVTTGLIGVFVPAVREGGLTVDDLNLNTRGVLARFEGGVEWARTLRTGFSLDFTSSGLPRFRDARFDVRLTGLESGGDDVAEIARSVAGRELPDGLSAILSRLGAISLTGEASGGLNDFEATGDLHTGAGNADLAAKVTSGGRNGENDGAVTLDGRISTSHFDLGRVLSLDGMGALAGVFTADGTVGNYMAGTLHGEVGALEMHDYTYTGLTFDGTVDGRRYGLDLSARDPALKADLVASLDRTDDSPRYTLDLDLEKADFAAAHIDHEDPVSVLSARISARMSGHGLDDAVGTVEVRDAAYTSAGGTVSTPLATIEARNSEAGKYLAFDSEFADGEFRSRTGYRDMLAYLGGFLQRYIPMPDLGRASATAPAAPAHGGDPAAASNYSIVSLNVKETGQLLETLVPGASIAPGSAARFMFNPYTGSFSLSGRSGFMEYGGMLAADIEITADNAADSLTVYISGKDIWSGRGHIPSFELHGGSKGRQQVDVALDGRVWRISADSVGFGAGRVGLEGIRIFATDAPGQRLTASGVVSRNPGDTLHVRLNRFDLSPFGRLAGRASMDLTGLMTGWLDIVAPTGDPGIEADIRIDGLAAEGHRAPPIRFISHPGEEGGMRFELVNENTNGDIARGTLSQGGRIDAGVRIDSLDAAMLDPLLGGIIEDTRGTASARLTLGGTLRNLRVDGEIDVPWFETTVGYTRARYGVGNARIEVDNSVLRLPRTPVTNSLGGAGDVAMSIDLGDLRNPGVEIEANTDRMLAFDTGPGDSEAFYGRVYATGSATIRSGRMGTRIDISGRTDAGTRFHLPLNAKSNVSWADFVLFADHTAPPDTTDVLARKRLAYERRLAGATGSAGSARRSRPLELNLTASVTPAAEVHMLIDPNLGQGITGRGEGVIDMRINPASDLFTMTGDYNISSGRFEFSMMNVFNKTFDITPGSTLRWTGAADDALLSIDASYRTRTSLLPLVGEGSGLVSGRSVPVDCIIRLRERLSDPEITFDIAITSADPEQRQVAEVAMNTEDLKSMQFLSLLTTGSFASDNSITGQAANAGVAATGAVGFDILTNQLNNFLSSEDYDIYFRYRPQDGFATNEVDMGFSTGFWDNRLQLEIEGNWVDNRDATSVGNNNASNLAGDVSLTWAIDQAGNLRLKVFSRNIDRRDENQGLQESGLGIHYKKDFDRVSDVFRRNPRRKEDNFRTFARDSIAVETPGRKRKQN